MRFVESVAGQPHKETVFDWTDAVVENLNAFRDACLGLAPHRFSHEEMIHNIEVAEATATSAEHRRTVQLEH